MNDYVIINNKNYDEKEYLEYAYKKNISYKDAIKYFDENKKIGLWTHYKRVIKDNGAIALFADGSRFTTHLINSNIKDYRHKWIWNKNNSAGFATAKFRPFQICEDILIFGKNKVNYYPIMEKKNYLSKGGATSSSSCYGNIKPINNYNDLFYPKNLLSYTKANSKKNCLHPTQKPAELLEYLIKTYTNENEVVLDNCAGVMSTAIACINTNRKYIMIEKDENYYNIGVSRLLEHENKAKF